MKNIILDILKQALCGRKLWKKIISKNKVDLKYDFVVLVSKDDKQCAYYTLLYLNKFIEKLELRKNWLEKQNVPVIRRNEKFFVLTDDGNVEKYAKMLSRRVTKVEILKKEELDNVVTYYSVYPYTDRLLIGKYSGIAGRKGCEVLLKSKLSIEELVADGVYDLKIGKNNRKTRTRIPKKIYKDPDFYNYVCQNDLRINDE